jgi:hypothetical protein
VEGHGKAAASQQQHRSINDVGQVVCIIGVNPAHGQAAQCAMHKPAANTKGVCAVTAATMAPIRFCCRSKVAAMHTSIRTVTINDKPPPY